MTEGYSIIATFGIQLLSLKQPNSPTLRAYKCMNYLLHYRPAFFNAMQISDAEEKKRLQILHEFGLLDTENEKELDELTQLAAAICKTPIALISLIDENRQWFKAKFGIDVPQTERSIAFCHHAIKSDNLFEIEDAKLDERFAENPLVTGNPNIRYYAGAPLITKSGHKLGTLCVIDKKPNSLTPEQKNILTLLSKEVINNFELRLSRKELRKDKNNLEETVKKKVSEFKTLAENSTDIIFRLDRNKKFIFINKLIFAELRCEPHELYGKTPAEAGIPHVICKIINENCENISSTPAPQTNYVEFPERTGSPFNFTYITTVPETDDAGEIASFLILIRDITELKLNEQKLIQTNQELDRFVYSASHELRAPLKSILGLTGLARNDFNSGNYQFQENYLNGIENSIKRLDTLVKDIIDYSRNTRLELNAAKIEFYQLINHTLHDLEYINKLPIQTEIKVEGEANFFSDKMRMSIILTNLISNALKYADPNKSKHVLTIKVQTFAAHCKLQVSDNGIGIAENHLDKICKMFFRATTLSEGAGLGLYIVKETVDRLHGKIKFNSVLHEGTTIEVELPNNVEV